MIYTIIIRATAKTYHLEVQKTSSAGKITTAKIAKFARRGYALIALEAAARQLGRAYFTDAMTLSGNIEAMRNFAAVGLLSAEKLEDAESRLS